MSDNASQRLAHSPQEVAELLGISRDSVYRAIETKQLEAVKLGNLIRVTPAAVAAWLAEGSTAKPQHQRAKSEAVAS